MYQVARQRDVARGAEPLVVERGQVVLGIGQALLGRALVPARGGRVVLGDAEPEIVGHAQLVLRFRQAAPGGGLQQLDLVLVRVGLKRAGALQPRQRKAGEVESALGRRAVPARSRLGIAVHAQAVLVERAEIELCIDVAGEGELGPGIARRRVVAALERLVAGEEIACRRMRRNERRTAQHRRRCGGGGGGDPPNS